MEYIGKLGFKIGKAEYTHFMIRKDGKDEKKKSLSDFRDFKSGAFSSLKIIVLNICHIRVSVTLYLKLSISYSTTDQNYHNTHSPFSFPLRP